MSEHAGEPCLVITEQPQSRGLRFRYQCENRGFTPGAILGADSDSQNRSYPTVEIRNYTGPAKIVVSCVTTEETPSLHPHRLVGHEGCSEGICEIPIFAEANTAYSVKSLGIQCIRRKDIESELGKRESRYKNPFKVSSGYSLTINLNAIRLCFELHVMNFEGQFVPIFPPALSTTIYDKKASPNLVICSMSASDAPASGGKQIILLTEKINKDDVQVRFFKDNGLDQKPWIAYGKFNPATNVHKQFAIVLKTPAYCDTRIKEPVTVKIQLQRKRSNELSEPKEFKFLPAKKRSRKRTNEGRIKIESASPTTRKTLEEIEPIEQPLPGFGSFLNHAGWLEALPHEQTEPFVSVMGEGSSIDLDASRYEFSLEDIFDCLYK